jgi:hypothetical protein
VCAVAGAPVPSVFLSSEDVSRPGTGPGGLSEIVCRPASELVSIAGFRYVEKIAEWALEILEIG